MLCHKNRAAVLKRLDRCLVCVDLLRNLHDLSLVKTDQRTVNRKSTHRVSRRQALHSLTRHLSDTLSRYQSQTAVLFCELLCDPHHITAHNDRQLIVRAFLVDRQLNVRKVNDMEFDRSRIRRDKPCQINDLLLRPLACIRRRMKISRLDLHAPSSRSYIPPPGCQFLRREAASRCRWYPQAFRPVRE